MRARQVQSNETLQIIIGYSPRVTADLHIEFGGKTYKVVSIDSYGAIKSGLFVPIDSWELMSSAT